MIDWPKPLRSFIEGLERLRNWLKDRSPGPLLNAYRDSTNARLDAIERELSEIKHKLNVLSLGPDSRK